MSSSADLDTRIRRLEDRAEIGELVSRYGLVIDDRDVAAMDGLFTPDVRIWSADGVIDVSGIDAVIAMFRGRFALLGPSNHFTHDRLVDFDLVDPDRANGLVLSHAEMQRKGLPMLAAIRYHDAYQRLCGCWRFRERRLSFMYYVPTAEYLDAFGQGIARRMRAYDHPAPADWPENLSTWRDYYGT